MKNENIDTLSAKGILNDFYKVLFTKPKKLITMLIANR